MIQRCIQTVFCTFILLFSGCVSYEYTGSCTGKATTEVEVFSEPAKITRQYRVLGTAVVSGNYQDVSREQLLDTLVKKAGQCGADAVLITEQQVQPTGEISRPLFDTVFDRDDTNPSWSQIDRDVDLVYGEIGKKNAPNIQTFNTYRRILKAKFLQYTPESGK